MPNIFNNVQSPMLECVVIPLSFTPIQDNDDTGGTFPSDDGYDAYGAGFTCHKDGYGRFHVILADRFPEVTAVLGGVSLFMTDAGTLAGHEVAYEPLMVIPIQPVCPVVSGVGPEYGVTPVNQSRDNGRRIDFVTLNPYNRLPQDPAYGERVHMVVFASRSGVRGGGG